MKCLGLTITFASAIIGTIAGDPPCSAIDPAAYNPQDIIYRDVVVIGGGSSGVYSSMRLKDHNKTVMVIERQDKLGGHAEAWIDPESGTPIDIGVVVFAHTDTVKDYFARFNLSLAPLTGQSTPQYVDFSTGKMVNYTEPNATAFGEALDNYVNQLNRYPDLQDSFNMSYPVPPDLLLSFGDFVDKYGLQDLVPKVFLYNQGAVPLLDINMIYTFKYLNLDEVNSLKQGSLALDKQSVTELYRRAAENLGPDVLFNSTVNEMNRTDPNEVRVSVNTPAGTKLVIAKKILSTIPPLLSNLDGYDLSISESGLFSQFYANGYYTAVLNNTGLDNAQLVNHDPSGLYGVPTLPGIYSMNSRTLPGNRSVTQVYYGSPEVEPKEMVKADIVKLLHLFQAENGLPETEPTWLKFSSHSPFNLMVPDDNIRSGFYNQLFAMQGQRNTFYNGAAWHAQDSSVLWEFTDNYVVPIMLASMQ